MLHQAFSVKSQSRRAVISLWNAVYWTHYSLSCTRDRSGADDALDLPIDARRWRMMRGNKRGSDTDERDGDSGSDQRSTTVPQIEFLGCIDLTEARSGKQMPFCVPLPH